MSVKSSAAGADGGAIRAIVKNQLTQGVGAAYSRRVEIRSSAFKHGLDAEDIRHAWSNAVRLVEYDYDGDERLLVIGPSRHGHLLELVAVPAAGPSRIVHADRLRPKFYDYLR